jgi:FKBP12-rapamycin complex-associated protein
MIATLEPLHERIENPGPETLSEVGFAHAFGRDLKEASEWLQAYRESYNRGGDLSYLNQAWDLYYNVFKVISKHLDAKSLELRHVSPQLLHASSLQLAVPGRYVDATGEPIRIERFSPTMRVIRSKQRPRVVTMRGSDGADHMFLLKGHEDLRLDERVMQLLGLVNNLLAGDGETHRADVEIQKYAVVPLSSRAGVMQWVPSCDTLHELIKEYRDARKIMVNIEHRVISEFAPQYEMLLPIQKVEVFEHAIRETSGQDLAKVLWLKSANSETWLDRRTNFTRSLAAMSIVGYVLGLGDRHPSNLMCERASGRILHIDFGDCFEVAMHRDKYPEGVPFRLTRMLVNAMEVSGIEGNYRITCENVMRVLRANKESVMTMLSAFVHDPLITWRLFKPHGRPSAEAGADDAGASGGEDKNADNDNQSSVTSNSKPATDGGSESNVASSASSRGQFSSGLAGRVANQMRDNEIAGSFIGSVIERGVARSYVSIAGGNGQTSIAGQGDKAAALNERAVEVIERVRAKLRGTDFDPTVQLDVKEQVDLLIRQAQSHENLAVLYSGWSAVW